MAVKERQSNFELLRIVGMFLIILHHLAGGGLWVPQDSSYSMVFIVKQMLSGHLGWIGNWIFILISGYFISNSNFSWKKLFKLWFQVFSISAIIGLIFYFSKTTTIAWSSLEAYNNLGFSAAAKCISLKDLIHSFLPTYLGEYWFFRTYFIFYIFTPYLNSYLKKIEKQEHRNLVITMFFLVIVLQWLPKERFLIFDRLTSLYNFIFGYFLANYIKLYNPKFLQNRTRNLIISISWTLLYMLFIILIYTKPQFCFGLENMLYRHTNTMSFHFIPALLLFCTFKDINIKRNKIINKISSTCFGIYLIHLNVPFRYWLNYKIFKIDNFYNSNYLIPYMLVITIIIFISCSILELLRRNLIDKPLFKIIDKHWK